MTNSALAWAVLDEIEAHPQSLDMNCFYSRGGPQAWPGTHLTALDELSAECGTVACFAGWTVAMSGYRIVGESAALVGPVGSTRHIAELAQELLGLNDAQATKLFYVTNNNELPARIEEIFGPRPEVPDPSTFTDQEKSLVAAAFLES